MGKEVDLIKVRSGGNKYELKATELNTKEIKSKQELFTSIEGNLGLLEGSLSEFKLDVNVEEKILTLHPSTVFKV
jgi:hypothetical protein